MAALSRATTGAGVPDLTRMPAQSSAASCGLADLDDGRNVLKHRDALAAHHRQRAEPARFDMLHHRRKSLSTIAIIRTGFA
jgi:SpoU rRNA methylase family enzyme